MSGRVLYGGREQQPLARAWVVLHRVTPAGGGGPIDSVRTDTRGAYALTVARTDTSVVYDTTSAGPGVQVARRLVTFAHAKADGSRDALELLELLNPGRKTRIAPDTARPTWTGAVPHEAIQFQVGQGDLSAEAVTLRGDSVAVFGPVPPGEPKQLSYAYVLPGNVERLALPVDQATAELDLLLEDTTAAVAAPQLDTLGREALEGRRFARYRARSLPAGAAVTIAFPAPSRTRAEALVPWVVALAAVALAVGFVVALRRKPPLAAHYPIR